MSFPRDLDKLKFPTFPTFALHVAVYRGGWKYTIVRPNGTNSTGNVSNLDVCYKMLTNEMRDWHQDMEETK